MHLLRENYVYAFTTVQGFELPQGNTDVHDVYIQMPQPLNWISVGKYFLEIELY